MGKPADLKASMRRTLFVPESTHALKVLELFKQSGIHLSLVVDEYGTIQGLITLNDIMEEIVGEIPSIEKKYFKSKSCKEKVSIRHWAASC